MSLKLRGKILLVTLALVAVTQLATLVSVRSITTRHIAQSTARNLTIGSAVYREFMHSRIAQLGTTARVMAADFGVKEAVASGDEVTIVSALDNHRRRVGADVGLLLNLDGKVIAGFESEFGGPLLLPELLAAEGGTAAAALRLGDDYFELLSVPVRAPVPIAWAVLGFRIDKALAARAAALTGLEISFVDAAENRPIATTLQPDAVERLGDSLYGSQFRVGIGPGAAQIVGKDMDAYLTAWHPVQESAGGILAVLQLSMGEALTPYRTARNAVLLFAAVALLAGIFGASWLAKAVSFPVSRLAGAAARFAAGDYSAPVRLRSKDELGDLAQSFEHMRQAVAEREKRIKYIAEYDPLTTLPNRTRLLTLLEQGIHSFARLAVAKLEIKQFTQLTSTLGYGTGEALVKLAASRLSGMLSDGQALARISGAEFVVVLPDCGEEAARLVIDRMQAVLATGTRVDKASINLSLIAGVALYPDDGDTPEDLLRRASIAKADAQRAETSVACYRHGREDGQVRRLRLIGDLQTAIDNEQLLLEYQPKLRIADGSVRSAEALVRWLHPEFGRIPPDEFIPLAEQFNQIDQLTRWVIARAVRQCGDWQHDGIELEVAVNLSARDLMDETLPYFILDALKDAEITAGQLTIEVTESAIMRDLEKCISVLECLCDLGVRVAIDDFGTGHSSFLQLKHMPLHELKVDRSFVSGLLTDDRDDAIVQTTVDLAHRLGLEVVAEGIESNDILEHLGELGCEYAQGYGISRPQPPEALAEWLRQRTVVADRAAALLPNKWVNRGG